MICSLLGLVGITLVVGGILLIVGLEGERIGDEPRCRRCNYELTGLVSERCPECGAEVSEKNTVKGARRRNRRFLVIASVILGVSVTGLGVSAYSALGGIDWYQYLPTRWLISSVRAGGQDACNELARRIKAGTLQPEQQRRLAEIALQQHAAGVQSDLWADLLAVSDSRKLLSKDDQERFYRQIAPVRFRARPSVRLGELIIVEVGYANCGSPTRPYTWRFSVDSLQIGSDPAPCPIIVPLWHQDLDGQIEYPPEKASLAPIREGLQEVVFVGRHTLYAPSVQSMVGNNPVWSSTERFVAEVQVLPTNAPDPIKLVHDDELASTLRYRIKAEDATLHRQRVLFRSKYFLHVWLRLSAPLTTDLAFDVLLQHEDQTVPIDTVTWARGDVGWKSVSGGPIEKIEANRIDLILRTSRRAARNSVDCYDIWKGEIRLDDVPLARE